MKFKQSSKEVTNPSRALPKTSILPHTKDAKMNHSGHNNIVASPRSRTSSTPASPLPQRGMAPPPKALDPLQHLLSDVVARLEVLESKAGVTNPSSSTSHTLEKAASSRVISSSGTYVTEAIELSFPQSQLEYIHAYIHTYNI